MGKTNIKEQKRQFRHNRIRKKIYGTSERPRLCVSRSLKNFSAQIIDDQEHKVIIGMSTMSKNFKTQWYNMD